MPALEEDAVDTSSFDPEAYLAERDAGTSSTDGFDPEAYLAERDAQNVPQGTSTDGFDPEAYLAERAGQKVATANPDVAATTQAVAATPAKIDPAKNDKWNEMQARSNAMATEAGLPPAASARDRLIGAIQRSEAAGYPVKHFIGSPNEPTGDRGPTMDVENLVGALRQRAAKDPSAAKELAYWENDLAANGMTAEQWKQQTGEAQPGTPQGYVGKGEFAPEANVAPIVPRQPGQTSVDSFKKAMTEPAVTFEPIKIEQSDSELTKIDKTQQNLIKGFVSGATSPAGALALLSPFVALSQIATSAPDIIKKLEEADNTPAGSPERHEAAAETIATILPFAIHGMVKSIRGETPKPTVEPVPAEPDVLLTPDAIKQATDLVGPKELRRRADEYLNGMTPEGRALYPEDLPAEAISMEAAARKTLAGDYPESPATEIAQPQTATEPVAEGPSTFTPTGVANVPTEPIEPGIVGARKQIMGEKPTPPLETAPVEAPGPEKVQHGEFPEPGYTATDVPHVSTMANRFTQERAARGEIGEVVPGQGASTTDLVQQGLKMGPEEVNQHVSDLMSDTGDIVKQGQAVRAEEARLSERSNQASRAAQAEPNNLDLKIAADNAFKDLTDFHNGPVAKIKNKWHKTGMEMQGEIPVDLSTYNGLREQWLRDTGEAPPPKMEPTLQRAAKRVSDAIEAENGVRTRLGEEIAKNGKRKLPTADEVRSNIRERMGLEPCKV